MELSQEFKDYIQHKVYYAEKSIKNPSAFTMIYQMRGLPGRFGEVRSAIEDYMKHLSRNVVYTVTLEKRVNDVEVTRITFKD